MNVLLGVLFPVLAGAAKTYEVPCGYLLDATRTYYRATVPDALLWAEGILDDNGDLRLDLWTRMADGSRVHGFHGADQYAKILAHFGPRVWRVAELWTVFSDNLKEFNRRTAEGMAPEEAARLTWGGRQAAMHGFPRAQIRSLTGTPGNYEEAEIYFLRDH